MNGWMDGWLDGLLGTMNGWMEEGLRGWKFYTGKSKK